MSDNYSDNHTIYLWSLSHEGKVQGPLSENIGVWVCFQATIGIGKSKEAF